MCAKGGAHCVAAGLAPPSGPLHGGGVGSLGRSHPPCRGIHTGTPPSPLSHHHHHHQALTRSLPGSSPLPPPPHPPSGPPTPSPSALPPSCCCCCKLRQSPSAMADRVSQCRLQREAGRGAAGGGGGRGGVTLVPGSREQGGARRGRVSSFGPGGARGAERGWLTGVLAWRARAHLKASSAGQCCRLRTAAGWPDAHTLCVACSRCSREVAGAETFKVAAAATL